eukprot:scaffold766_cov179-Amphora_coffeaeformis.AAC.16
MLLKNELELVTSLPTPNLATQYTQGQLCDTEGRRLRPIHTKPPEYPLVAKEWCSIRTEPSHRGYRGDRHSLPLYGAMFCSPALPGLAPRFDNRA